MDGILASPSKESIRSFGGKRAPTRRGGKESPHIFRVKCARRLAGVAKGFLSPR
jgi:hypothetical protein